jgi:hypothetical protein
MNIPSNCCHYFISNSRLKTFLDKPKKLLSVLTLALQDISKGEGREKKLFSFEWPRSKVAMPKKAKFGRKQFQKRPNKSQIFKGTLPK